MRESAAARDSGRTSFIVLALVVCVTLATEPVVPIAVGFTIVVVD